MPSWNIHIAHVERLGREHDLSRLGIRDVNAFLFGNLVPDIYVGYLVKPLTKELLYSETHFTVPHTMPVPRYDTFWTRFGLPSRDEEGRVSDVALGAWCHLACDAVYNGKTRRYIDARGIPMGEHTRMRKQADFELFGRSLNITMAPHETPELLAQCAAFPQYAIEPADVRATLAVAQEVVAQNQRAHVEHPTYDLLNQEFFDEAFEEANKLLFNMLLTYALCVAHGQH